MEAFLSLSLPSATVLASRRSSWQTHEARAQGNQQPAPAQTERSRQFLLLEQCLITLFTFIFLIISSYLACVKAGLAFLSACVASAWRRARVSPWRTVSKSQISLLGCLRLYFQVRHMRNAAEEEKNIALSRLGRLKS